MRLMLPLLALLVLGLLLPGCGGRGAKENEADKPATTAPINNNDPRAATAPGAEAPGLPPPGPMRKKQ